jgi:hypothetical protein
MDDLIEALTILRKYGNPRNPTNCDSDVMWVNIQPEQVSDEDMARLDALGFFVSSEYPDGFMSFRFGSC